MNRHGRHREYPLVGLGQRLKDGGCPGRQWDRSVLPILRVADRQLPSAQVQVALQDLQQFPAPHTRFDSQFDQGPEVGGLAGLGCVTEPVELTGSTMGSVVDAGQVPFFDFCFLRLWLRRKLSPFISRIWTWWVRRSSKAPVRRSEPNTSVHSSNGRLEVTRIEPRS